MSNIIHFRELERARREDSDEVIVYEAVINNTLFGYLYLNSTTYTLVWTGSHDSQFNEKQPYTFIKQQFSYLSQAEIKLVDFVLPDRRPRSEAAAKVMHFNYNKSIAALLLRDGINQSLIEYDLLDSDDDRQQYVENLRNPEYVSRITFARYDSEIKTKKYGQVDCCFTAERSSDVATDVWEFTVNLPRSVPLRERALIWMARNHQAEELKRDRGFKEFETALSNILGLQEGPVFSTQ